MSGYELKYISEAFKTNWIAPNGPNIDAFELSLANFIRIKSVAVVNSGTSAIHLALILLGVKRGDEVIVSTLTFSGSVNPVIYQGATPIFVDSEKETWNISPDLLESTIKERLDKGKKLKAIIVVHLYGMPANLNKIMDIANYYNIPVVEDAAEALGSRFENKCVGTFGNLGVFSFNGNKIITTSGGGALVSNNHNYIDKARFLATQARDKAPHYQHSQIGYNYRMSNVLAGIGRGQMEVLNERIEERRRNFFYYLEKLGNISGIEFPMEPDNKYFSNRWLTTIIIDPVITEISRNDLYTFLEKSNIETRPIWKPMHLQPVFSDCPAYLNGVSDKLFENGLCLPSGSNLSDNDRQRVIEGIYSCLHLQ
jgi:dTDP-4-amino-4,6-dideoxygalactose transaminase